MTKLEEARAVYEAGEMGAKHYDLSKMALAIDALIGKALAEKEAALEAALEREREIGRNNAQAWQSTVTRMEMALAEKHQEQLDSDKRWKERLKAERLRSEQAAVLERKNWDAYREGEQKRIEAAVLDERLRILGILETDLSECNRWGEPHRASAINWAMAVIRKEASPVSEPEQPAYDLVGIDEVETEDHDFMFLVNNWRAP